MTQLDHLQAVLKAYPNIHKVYVNEKGEYSFLARAAFPIEISRGEVLLSEEERQEFQKEVLPQPKKERKKHS